MFPKPGPSTQRRRRRKAERDWRAIARKRLSTPHPCDVCGTRPATECHHIRRRGAHMHDEARLLDVCHKCHAWLHQHPDAAFRIGLLERRNGDPV